MEVLRMEETKMTTTELYHNIQDAIANIYKEIDRLERKIDTQ
jgi:hypothetical protein